MYGTVARLRIKPGKVDQLKTEMGAFEERRVPGFVASYVYQMDADPNELYLAVVFESKEAYHTNAQDPAQDEQYRRLVSFLDAEPEWHDGEIIQEMRAQ